MLASPVYVTLENNKSSLLSPNHYSVKSSSKAQGSRSVMHSDHVYDPRRDTRSIIAHYKQKYAHQRTENEENHETDSLASNPLRSKINKRRVLNSRQLLTHEDSTVYKKQRAFASRTPTLSVFVDSVRNLEQSRRVQLFIEVRYELLEGGENEFSETNLLMELEEKNVIMSIDKTVKFEKAYDLFLDLPKIEKFLSLKARNVWVIFKLLTEHRRYKEKLGWFAFPLYKEGYLAEGALQDEPKRLHLGQFTCKLILPPFPTAFPLVEDAESNISMNFKVLQVDQ